MTPRPYQEVGRDFLAARTRALLADEMRVGKTPQAILAAAQVGAQRILTVCPAIAVPQWKQEWIRWWPAEYLPFVEVLSYDGARNRAAELAAQVWDVFIVDEAHFAKNPVAARTKMVYGKGGIGWNSKHIWALSGTPAPKHAGELWPMLRAFGAVGLHYYEFLRRYCRFGRDQRVVGTKTSMIPELKEILAKVMLRRMRKEVAPEVPEIGFNFLYVEPHYNPSVNMLAATELRCLTGSALLEWLESNAAHEQAFRIAVAQAKVPALVDEIAAALEGALYTQTVVFGHHVAPLTAVAQALSEKGVKTALLNGSTSPKARVDIQAAFKRGEIQVVVANITAAGTAIDLSAARHAYFLELDWVPGTNVQAANRLVDVAKTDPVTVDVVTWPGSTDDRVQRVLLTRAQELSKIF